MLLSALPPPPAIARLALVTEQQPPLKALQPCRNPIVVAPCRSITMPVAAAAGAVVAAAFAGRRRYRRKLGGYCSVMHSASRVCSPARTDGGRRYVACRGLASRSVSHRGRVARRARFGDGYSWEQDPNNAKAIKVYVPVAEEVDRYNVDFSLEANGVLTVGTRGSAHVIDQEPLWGSIIAKGSDWSIEEVGGHRSIVVTLKKRNGKENWEHLFKKECAADWRREQMDRVKDEVNKEHVEEAEEILRGMTVVLVNGTAGLVEPVLLNDAERGRGWRAAKPISAGSVLLEDNAFCFGRSGPSQYVDMRAQCLSRYDDPFFKLEVMGLTTADDHLIPGASRFEAAPQLDISFEERLLDILQNNCFECSREPGYKALFVSIARLNHSCRPNAFLDSSKTIGVVRALRPIEVGEEVCISYVPVSDGITERSRKLKLFGFDCKCKRCQEELEADNGDPGDIIPCRCGATHEPFRMSRAEKQTCPTCGVAAGKATQLRWKRQKMWLREVSDTNLLAESPEAVEEHRDNPRELVKMLAPMTLPLDITLATLPTEDEWAKPIKRVSVFDFKPKRRRRVRREEWWLGVPARHHEVLKLLDKLSMAYYKISEGDPQHETALGNYWLLKERFLTSLEENHGRDVDQRDPSYIRHLWKMLLGLSPEAEQAEWQQKLTLACKLQYGQAAVPKELVQDLTEF